MDRAIGHRAMMKKLYGVLIGMVLYVASMTAAQAGIIQLKASIDGLQGVPPTGSSSQALAALTYDTSTMILDWVIDEVTPFFDTSVNFAHFHGPAAPGTNAGVQVWICDNTGFGPAGTSACGDSGDDFAAGSATLTEGQSDDLLDSRWYINIHTAEFPGGEIRGQVLSVPVPTTLVLFGLGLAGLGYARRKKA